MLFGAVSFSGREWFLPAAVLLLAVLCLVVWSYRNATAYNWVRLTCAALKLLGFSGLLLCLLEPLWNGQRAVPRANLFGIAADNSQGMQIKDRGQPLSRGELLRQLLAGQSSKWQEPLDENFQVRRFVFDSRLQASRDFAELQFDGPASAIGTSLRAMAERLKGQPVAGILLFTDGNATDLTSGAINVEGLPPIFPVVSGNDAAIKDIALQKVAVTQTAFEDAPVTIQADVTTTGYEGSMIVAELLDLGGGTARGTNSQDAVQSIQATMEQVAKARRDGELLTFRFQIRPLRTGIIFYRVRVSAREEREQFAQPQQSAEATLANNSREVVVDRGQGPYRILFVSGRPNWEYKFLNRAVAEDEQVQLVGLIRVARREPKFTFKGRAGEASNPLFRGFDRKTEDTERYDQPVLVRLNTRDEHELRGGFPKTSEELYQYQGVIIDDLEAEFFSPEQRLLLQKFVSERGGGFLMLGGQECFQEGKYDRTPIGDMLPVYLEALPSVRMSGDLRIDLTREGLLQPWMRLRSTEAEERSRLNETPPFHVLNQARSIKPGATIMATISDGAGHIQPALVVQRFGYGRTGALLVGDVWRSGLHDESSQADLGKSWRQLIRWLVADVPGRITLQTQPKTDDANQAVQLQVRVRDESFQPLDNAAVSLTIRPVMATAADSTDASTRDSGGDSARSTGGVHLATEPAVAEPGLYQASYVPRQTGGYHAIAVVTNAVGAELGRAETGWTTDLAADEFRSLKPNRALLESIAARTGGEVISATGLNEFVQSLPHRKMPITESYSVPLWHKPTVFLLALGCFVAEWGLRRWKGMA